VAKIVRLHFEFGDVAGERARHLAEICTRGVASSAVAIDCGASRGGDIGRSRILL
jgi:hypothetical protein